MVDDLEALVKGLPPRRIQVGEPELATRYVRTTQVVGSGDPRGPVPAVVSEDYRPGIGIVGCGGVVRTGHLPGYRRYGQRVVGVYDVRPEATEGVREQFGVETIFGELDELLSHPEIEIVDVATHPDVRPALVRQALAAGKHVLAQKPFAADLKTARELVEEAERLGLEVAVNQNGRWAPAWRAATC